MPSTTLPATLDSQIHLNGSQLPSGAVEEVIGRLTIDNPTKAKAERQNEPGWKGLPDYIDMWQDDGDELIVPRGFAFELVEILDDYKVELEWEDRRTLSRGFPLGTPIDLYPEQQRIVETILELEQGILKSPTGSGKTVSMLEIFRRIAGPGIVIVNTKEIAAQWIARCRKFLGPDYPVSMIGDGKFEIAEQGLTVAIQATLWSRREKLAEEGFFERFVVAALDECHHATAATYNEIFNRFTAKIRMGASATPEKTGEFRLAEVVIGPIVVEITEDEIGDSITKPIVEVIETKLGARKRKSKGKRSGHWSSGRNFNSLVKKLVADEERTELVAKEILINHAENANIVLSKRIAHLEAIYDALVSGGFPEERLLAMVGNHKIDERSKAIAMVEDAACVLLTTLADEALDAPRLDRCHLAFPTKNPELVLQQIGRIRRQHPDKTDSIVLDYCDRQVEMFLSQYMTRRHCVYNERGFVVIKRKVSDPHACL